MAQRKVYHIVPNPGQEKDWKIKEENIDEPLGLFSNKEEAIEKAKEIAKANEPSQIIIHREDGQIQTEYTYGDDPRKYKG
jgi:hypothetical protein